jgi:hypothetical protein
MPENHVLRWEDEPPEHPVIAELRAQPGRWAILRDQESHPACLDHPNVETKADVDCHGADVAKARWVPDPMVSALGKVYAQTVTGAVTQIHVRHVLDVPNNALDNTETEEDEGKGDAAD